MNDPIRYLSQRGYLTKFYIGGVWDASVNRETTPVINPASAAPIAEISLGNESDVHRAVTAAREAVTGWSHTSVDRRAALLDCVTGLLRERSEILARAISVEMGAAITYARRMQVPLAIEHVRVAREVLSAYDFVRRRGGTAILREAIGVCGLITPWNWPLYQITAKVAPALAAGCTVVLKPSELSPLSALLFAEVMHDAGFPAGVFNLVNGPGSVVGSLLAAHPQVDMISITGSTQAGIRVAQAAAPTVKRVAQELGGKSPNIILPDADLSRAVPLGVAAGFRNVGQSCSAPTRMLVDRRQLEAIESIAMTAVQDFVVGDPLADETTHGPIANRAQYQRVQRMIEVGLEEGAKLVVGGLGPPAEMHTGFYARPTIFSNVDPQMRIAQEEIFGPVLVIVPYDTVEHAIALANDTQYGLGAHVQGTDLEIARHVAARIRAGQVHINYPQWDPHVPFGGYKQSGNGREYGVEGMEEYLETKAILGFYP